MESSLPLELSLIVLSIVLANATGQYPIAIVHVYYTDLTSRVYTCFYAVTLDSSADSVCPGDTVVFTCATDTGELIWNVNGTLLYYSNAHEQRDVKLMSCSDNSIPQLSNTDTETVSISGEQIKFNTPVLVLMQALLHHHIL